MNKKNPSHKTGYYFGTEIDEKWWKRYSKDKMLARGTGEYWNDKDSFYFLRSLTKNPISIPINNIVAFKTGKWHAGKWGAGQKILKIIWIKNDQNLSSGFLIAKDEIEDLISALRNSLPSDGFRNA